MVKSTVDPCSKSIRVKGRLDPFSFFSQKKHLLDSFSLTHNAGLSGRALRGPLQALVGFCLLASVGHRKPSWASLPTGAYRCTHFLPSAFCHPSLKSSLSRLPRNSVRRGDIYAGEERSQTLSRSSSTLGTSLRTTARRYGVFPGRDERSCAGRPGCQTQSFRLL